MKPAASLSVWSFTVLVFMLPQLLSAGQTESLAPPNLPNFDNLPTTLSIPPATKLVLGRQVVDLEQTTLDQVLQSAGAGTIQHQGGGVDREAWICFTVPSSQQSQRIWLRSIEIMGDAHAIDAFYASTSSTPLKEAPLCPELPARLRPMSLGRSIWLGSSQDQLRGWLGEPSAKRGGWWLYSSSRKVANDFDEGGLLGARVVDGKVTALFASKSTMN
jgi:hypothetical protein